jgi:tetraacyldisaccharide 4'-kinase
MFRYPVAWMRITWLTLLLIPLSWLFRAAVGIRRNCYRTGLLRSERLPVPVIVVGNISVGGTGKTPLVLWLVTRLREAGYKPGIISRGYGGLARLPQCVGACDDASVCGDEPVLLARHSGCAVWIGKDRVAAALALLGANPACDVLVSDDGLQHYRLARDAEIAVVDGARGVGNGWMLPAGPLREPPSRLAEVDAVVVRGADARPALAAPLREDCIAMTLVPAGLRNLRDGRHDSDASRLRTLRVHAVAGIGNPPQFFDTLTSLGIPHTPHAFPDHHVFVAADLVFSDCDAIVMTEKDAVKCERFATDTHWSLQVDAVVDDVLTHRVLQRLQRKN